MAKAEITLQSPYVTSNPRADHKPTVYARSLRKLLDKKGNPGKIIRVYAHIENDYKVFGVFTLNTGGSISFFPDFFHLDNFDHVTINKDFLNKKGHLTVVEESGKHKQGLTFEIAKITDDSYHIVTFMMKDGDLLTDSLPEVHYPDIEFESGEETQFLSALKESIHTDPYMIEFPENEKGYYCIQVHAVPKGKDYKSTSIDVGVFNSFTKITEPISMILNANKMEIETPDYFEFSICIIAFKVDREFISTFAFAMAKPTEAGK